MAVPTVDGLPALAWTGTDGDADYGDGILTVTAAAGVDWTNDAFGGEPQQRATSLAFEAPERFALSARVRVEGQRSTFDAGALAIWSDADHWAKICFEFSPNGEPMVVSVVTADGFSDDCNSTLVDDDHVFLRVSRIGPGFAFHSSRDGSDWTFVRQFRFDVSGPLRVGFLAQAPLGSSCAAAFDEILLSTVPPADLRDGS
jgi:regulation of enolase protein 1 (concanavalin A-like superfamily)